MTRSYREFIERKGACAQPVGIPDAEASTFLFPFQADVVRWALRRGRAAIFADCGMGKSPMQIDWARRVHEHTGGDVLILAPLAVSQQTAREGEKFGVDVRVCRSQEQVRPGITVTNYEMLSRFDPRQFAGVVLDESSILKAYDGKTRTAIVEAFSRTPFRLACTATPAPNDFVELGNHSEFLGVMTRSEMLSMFFVHDGGSTQDWRVKGHAEGAFWRWVCSWGCMVRRPSDLGYDDGDFVLPPLDVVEHVVEADHEKYKREAGTLFAMEARTLTEQRAARRSTIEERVWKCADLVNASDRPWLVWCELNAEGDALEVAIDGAVQVAGSDSNEDKAGRMVDFTEGRTRVLVSKPSICGFGMNWQHCSDVAFVGLSHSYEQFYQAVRRCWRFGQRRPVRCHVITASNEGRVVDSIKRKEADARRMSEAMVRNTKDIVRAEVGRLARDSTSYDGKVRTKIPAWLRRSSEERT